MINILVSTPLFSRFLVCSPDEVAHVTCNPAKIKLKDFLKKDL